MSLASIWQKKNWKKNRSEIAKDVSYFGVRGDGESSRGKGKKVREKGGGSQLAVALHVGVGLSGLFTLITKIWQMFARLMSHYVSVCVWDVCECLVSVCECKDAMEMIKS